MGLVVVACGFTSPSPRPSPQSLIAEPSSSPMVEASTSPTDLPAPYDKAGVLAALNARMTTALEPTTEEAAQVGISREAFLANLIETIEASYPGERAQPVSVHLLVADIHDPHLVIDHRLAYVVETTGHSTGNCFTFYDADTAKQLVASCFHQRSRPP